MQHTSALRVSAKQCLITFGTDAPCRELELHLFDKWFWEESMSVICANSWGLQMLWFCVLNKSKSLTVLKPHFYLPLSCVNN